MEQIISVTDILNQDLSESHHITVTIPEGNYAGVTVLKGFAGTIDLNVLENDEIYAFIAGIATIELLCDRCLTPFSKEISIHADRTFTRHPTDLDEPVRDNNTIDLFPPISQEIVLAVPMKQLCKENCSGIQVPNGNDTK